MQCQWLTVSVSCVTESVSVMRAETVISVFEAIRYERRACRVLVYNETLFRLRLVSLSAESHSHTDTV